MHDVLDRLKTALQEHYRVERELGRGGMATVYLAEDLKHHRQVAIKVLLPDLALAIGSERFLQEIETAARLHHPHVLPLYDSGEADGLLYYVMPYVEGESLRDRLNREKQLPLDEALDFTREVADALSYTHSRGVVHRDIKPENILLEAGHALVADFGIATAVSLLEEGRLTETGTTVGTPAYMSPEQAAGSREIDGRSDLYSLACVLYEMLAGQPPFTGPTVESIVRQHLTVDPPSVTNIRQAVPPHVSGIISRALAKTPADRFSPAAQFAEALHPATVSGPEVTATSRPRWVGLVVAVVAVTIITVVGLALVLNTGESHVMLPPEPEQITFRGDLNLATISPDGEFIAYVVRGSDDTDRLLIQEIGGGEAIEIHSHPFLCCVQWSPDGSQVLFRSGTRTAGRTLLLPRLGGGTPRELNSEIVTAWSPDGSRIVSWWPQARSLWLTDVASGDTTGSIPLDMPHVWVYGVDWSPGGDRLAVITQIEGGATLWTIPLESGQATYVLEDTVLMISPRWSSRGNEIYYLRGHDQKSMELRKARLTSDGRLGEEPLRLLSAMPVGTRHQAIPAFTISADGRSLLYLRQNSFSNVWLAEIGGGGGARTVSQRQLTTGTAFRSNPRVSPDRRDVVYTEAAATQSNIHVVSIESGDSRQVTFQGQEVWAPAWSPEGDRIAYGTGARGSVKVWVVDRDGGTPRVFESSQFAHGNRLAWAPSDHIIYQMPDDQNYFVFDPDREEQSSLISELLNGWQYNPRPSPDGGRVAFWWNRTDSLPDGIWLVSTADGTTQHLVDDFHPINWNERGDAIFAMPGDPVGSSGDEVYLVPLSGRPAELYVTLPFRAFARDIDITPDGRMVVAAVEESQSDAWIVNNFDPELAGRSR